MSDELFDNTMKIIAVVAAGLLTALVPVVLVFAVIAGVN
jgi:hypothetical protein